MAVDDDDDEHEHEHDPVPQRRHASVSASTHSEDSSEDDDDDDDDDDVAPTLPTSHPHGSISSNNSSSNTHSNGRTNDADVDDLEHATRIVRDLWRQITERDAPAGNEPPTTIPTTTTTTLSVSTIPPTAAAAAAAAAVVEPEQQHRDETTPNLSRITPTSTATASDATLFGPLDTTSTTPLLTTTTTTTAATILQSPSVTKLGQGSLALLCHSVWHEMLRSNGGGDDDDDHDDSITQQHTSGVATRLPSADSAVMAPPPPTNTADTAAATTAAATTTTTNHPSKDQQQQQPMLHLHHYNHNGSLATAPSDEEHDDEEGRRLHRDPSSLACRTRDVNRGNTTHSSPVLVSRGGGTGTSSSSSRRSRSRPSTGGTPNVVSRWSRRQFTGTTHSNRLLQQQQQEQHKHHAHHHHVGSVPSSDDEEKKEDDPGGRMSGVKKPSLLPTFHPPPPASHRLQQFGSEYARHLSNSQLAPPRYQTNNNYSSSSNRNGSGSGIHGRFSRPHLPRRRGTTIRQQPCRILEQAPPDVHSGALLDICLTPCEDPPPAGYYRWTQTASGYDIPTTTTHNGKKISSSGIGSSSNSSGGSYRWNVKKEPVWDKAAQRPCVTAVTLIYPDRNEFVPPGFSVVRLMTSGGRFHTSTAKPSVASVAPHDSDDPMLQQPPANLNAGLPHTERVYLCLRRSREGNPITGLSFLIPTLGDAVPVGFTVVERTPRNHPACIALPPNTTTAGGTFMFLAYRQRLANLEPLRPRSLLQTIVPSVNGGESRLRAYYATGGTVVQSDVGRFHIMDRSTHSLLSPSSVANRFKVIEASRQRDRENGGVPTAAAAATGPYQPTTTSYARSDCESVGSFVSLTSSSMGSLSFPHLRIATAAASLMDCSIRESATEDGTHNDCDSECNTTKENTNPLSVLEDDVTANLSSLLSSMNEQNPIKASGTPTHEANYRHAMSFIPDIATMNAHENGGTDRLDSRKLLLTPILTACYSRHGGSALLAVEGLHSLLTESNFFADDVNGLEEANCQSSFDADLLNTNQANERITLLDLAIQAACDVATSGSQEILFPSCVAFVAHAMTFSQGHLNARTIGFVARFQMFVFYFDASIPRSTTQPPKWPSPSWRPVEMHDEEDFPMLYDPRETDETRTGSAGGGYLSGGAPQEAALALKELISLSIVRLGKVSVIERVNFEMRNKARGQCSLPEYGSNGQHVYKSMMDDILSSLVEDAVDCVERANYTQLALHQIHRSGGSELFWNDMTLFCGRGLFAKERKFTETGNSLYALNFAILQHFVKLSSGKLRPKHGNPEILPRDVASKILSLELLLHFLELWSDEQEALTSVSGASRSSRSIETMAFAVRRTVIPCLLWNTRAGFENLQVFRRIIRIFSELWSSPVYRKHCKIELGVLIEHFALNIIELGPQCYIAAGRKGQTSLLHQQIELIREIKNWFSGDPHDVIELYLNFDTDITSESTAQCLLPGTRWLIFQRLSAGICNIAEQCGERIGNQIQLNQSILLNQADKGRGSKADGSASRDAVKRYSSDSGETRDLSRMLRKVSLDTIAQIVKNLALSAGAATGVQFTAMLESWTHIESTTFYTNGTPEHRALLRPPSQEEQHDERGNIDSTAAPVKGGEGVLQFWTKAILHDKKLRAAASSPTTKESLDTAFNIARQKGMKKAVEYLIACNALTPAPRDVANFLRIHKDRFDPTALGLYLCGSGNSGTEVEYWNLIRQLFVRSMSFIGMHVEEGLRHFLTTSGFRLPGEAQQIDRIICTFAQCYFEDNAGDVYHCPFKNQDTVYLLVFAIIMLNTDLHKADCGSRHALKKMTKSDFTNNFKGAIQGENVSKEYLSVIFDSIASHPIAIHEAQEIVSTEESQNLSVNKIVDNVRALDSLLRGLAVHDFSFVTINDFTKKFHSTAKHSLSDLTCSCVSKTWHQWHGLVNTCLDTAHLDPQGMEPAVDILLYALVVTVCLEMPMERSAFLGQLVRLRAFEELRQGRWVTAADNGHHEEHWYLKLENLCSGLSGDKLLALRQIYVWVQSLKAALRVDVRNKVEMTEAVAELVKGNHLLDDPARSFLQSENLTKKSSRTGQSTIYRFYLFSDLLLYASKESDGRYRIHAELPLHLMKIVDWFPPFQKNRKIVFEVQHPSKSFQVICHSSDAKKSWVENIRAAILVEMERKMTTEAARLCASTTKANLGQKST